jgi:hypothetical protein
MSRRRPDLGEITARLAALKLMIRGTADAMPSLAREMRREACESIDDIIQDLGSLRNGKG